MSTPRKAPPSWAIQTPAEPGSWWSSVAWSPSAMMLPAGGQPGVVQAASLSQKRRWVGPAPHAASACARHTPVAHGRDDVAVEGVAAAAGRLLGAHRGVVVVRLLAALGAAGDDAAHHQPCLLYT